MLYDKGVPFAQKPFSIGVRIEHPQDIINRAQYGEAAVIRDLVPIIKFLKSLKGRYIPLYVPRSGGGVASGRYYVTNGMSEFTRISKMPTVLLWCRWEPRISEAGIPCRC